MISIIVPVYNSQKHLERCIESIINQSYKDIELILVNDGSNDNSIDICKFYQEKDGRIKVINQENKGVSAARNKGLEVAKGEFIQFVDSDDYIDENMSDILIKNYQDTKADFIVCGFKIVESDSKVIFNKGIDCKKKLNDFGREFITLMELNLLNSPCNKLYKKELITNLFDEEMKIGEDLIFNLLYLKNVNVVSCINETSYNYYQNNNSVTHKKNYIDINQTEKYYSKIISFCDNKFNTYNIIPIYKEFMQSVFYNIQCICESNSSYNEKIKLLNRTINSQLLKRAYECSLDMNNIEKRIVCNIFIKYSMKNVLIIYFFVRLKMKYLIKIGGEK